MAKTQSQTVIVNVKTEKEKKKRRRRTNKPKTMPTPRGVTQQSQAMPTQPIYRGIQNEGIQTRFVAPDPTTNRLLTDLTTAFQSYRAQGVPQPPPPSNAVIVSPPVGAMPALPAPPFARPATPPPQRPLIGAAPRARAASPPLRAASAPQMQIPLRKIKIAEKKIDKKVESAERDIENLIASLPKNNKGQVKRQGSAWTSLTNVEKAIIRDIDEKKLKPTARPEKAEPEPEPMKKMPAKPTAISIRNVSPSKRVSMLVDNSASQLYGTTKLGQPEPQNNDIDNALKEED